MAFDSFLHSALFSKLTKIEILKSHLKILFKIYIWVINYMYVYKTNRQQCLMD